MGDNLQERILNLNIQYQHDIKLTTIVEKMNKDTTVTLEAIKESKKRAKCPMGILELVENTKIDLDTYDCAGGEEREFINVEHIAIMKNNEVGREGKGMHGAIEDTMYTGIGFKMIIRKKEKRTHLHGSRYN